MRKEKKLTQSEIDGVQYVVQIMADYFVLM